MLETIREFALERFDEAADAAELRRRHAEHFLALALEAQPELVRRDQRHFLDRLEADHDNFRAALSWLLDRDRERTEPRSRSSCSEYTRGHVREGRDWLVAVLEGASPAPSATRAGALDWAGYLSNELGENARGLWKTPLPAPARPTPPPRSRSLSHASIALADGDEEDRRPGRRSGHRRAGRAIRSSSAPP